MWVLVPADMNILPMVLLVSFLRQGSIKIFQKTIVCILLLVDHLLFEYYNVKPPPTHSC